MVIKNKLEKERTTDTQDWDSGWVYGHSSLKVVPKCWNDFISSGGQIFLGTTTSLKEAVHVCVFYGDDFLEENVCVEFQIKIQKIHQSLSYATMQFH